MPAPKASAGMERKLAAILSADVAGYSRLTGEDEEATIRTLNASSIRTPWQGLGSASSLGSIAAC